MMNNYIGFVFLISNSSYINSKELVNSKYLIILLKSKLNHSIIVSSSQILKKELSQALVYEYDLNLNFIEIDLDLSKNNVLMLSLKISNLNSFSLQDMIPFTTPKIYTNLKKELNLESVDILNDELKIRVENCIDFLSLRKYLI